MSEQMISQKAPEPVGSYPHARRVGDLLFLSGVGPRKRGTKEIPGVTFDKNRNVVEYDVKAQTHSVIENVRTVLQDSGLDLKDLVDVQCFLTNMKEDFKGFNAVYAEYFSVETGPCRTTVEVGALPTPIAVEFKCLAKFPQSQP
ncbi:MAG: RidA family protein [Bdellovibrionales bacterium]|nr:RidA family protein [Bdellovibrionales bacterium]NQZ18194.1 RidA family protein [Bdellovibrionales bacterium]